MRTLHAILCRLPVVTRGRVLSRRTCGLSGRHESEDHWVSVLPRLGLVDYTRSPGVQVSHDLVSAGAGLKCPESVFYITTFIVRHSTRTSRSLSTALSTLGSTEERHTLLLFLSHGPLLLDDVTLASRTFSDISEVLARTMYEMCIFLAEVRGFIRDTKA